MAFSHAHSMHYLRPEADCKGDGFHSIGVPSYVEAPKEYTRQIVALGVEICQVSNVVRDHASQRHGNICRLILLKLFVLQRHERQNDGVGLMPDVGPFKMKRVYARWAMLYNTMRVSAMATSAGSYPSSSSSCKGSN